MVGIQQIGKNKASKYKITLKQKRFADAYARSGNKSEAVRLVYDTTHPQVLTNIANRNLNNPHVQGYMNDILNGVGLDLQSLSAYTHKIVKASVSKSSLKKAGVSDGLRGIEMMYRLHDAFPAERKIVDKREINLTLQGKSDSELAEELQRLASEAGQYSQLLAGSDNVDKAK